MASKQLHDLNIEDICKSINISKVTFFNYFKSKEEVVEYFIQLWQYEMAYMISEKDLKGLDTLYFLYDQVSSHPSSQSIMSALTAYFIKIDCYQPTSVSDYELYIYSPEPYTKGFRSVQLYEIVLKAIQEMQVSQDQGHMIMTHFMSGFYGIPLISKLGFGQNMQDMFHQYLGIFKQGGTL